MRSEREHADISCARDAELHEAQQGLRLHRDEDDAQEAEDGLPEGQRLSHLARVRVHRAHGTERLHGTDQQGQGGRRGGEEACKIPARPRSGSKQLGCTR